ncbi:hypothetical protein PBAL39_05613 [Pedobacter sp. BAL39]|uniref:hypothetical protein n=1 Tax=Pedobacter sp. BAL39 TaxID=391596 RepID=UPI0001559ADD|nr:hypothetical protein [Pedobacter sp. BAL39]EDM37251.1 hypothetical protein PBAL39_05613 [Pedobacter sp. BAL39]
MIPSERKSFNENFSSEKYQSFLKAIANGFQDIPFRVAETPVFIPADLRQQLMDAGDELIRFIRQPEFKTLSQPAIPEQWKVPGENEHPHFLCFDFGITTDREGKMKPMLIELQGFPSLYNFQPHLARFYKEQFNLTEELSPFFGGFDEASYNAMLRELIIGKHEPHEVAMMDLDPLNQKTAIDFQLTSKLLGIPVLSITDIEKKGNRLFYHRDGQSIQLKRIYNRVIFEEIDLETVFFEDSFDPRTRLDIEWITHPNWYYRISKYLMPFIKSDFVPETSFLNKLERIPEDLENYVLKPLFSFAGKGVLIDVTKADIEEIPDPEHWILQRKVDYAPLVQSPEGGVKVEVRLMYLWPDGQEPALCVNVTRLSRGKMIGVAHNQNFNWVGGTVGLMKL